ncbi:MAG TPA: S8 family serine peptidase [Steroidobacteraceae bacterium]|nr:S8 family serine peptidase [Steroidobacteraceae bacterium]
MRPLSYLWTLIALCVMAVAPCAFAQEPSESGSSRPLIVVTFANEPYRSAPRAGTTGTRYAGDRYGVSLSAHERARRIAALYSLREVASWPIKELAVHCVVYEIPDSRTVEDVLKTLAKDPRVTLAQPLQEFHTLTQSSPEPAQTPPAGPYNDPLYGLQANLVSLGIAAAQEHSQGEGVRVGLIDTGVDISHPDLRDRIVGTHSYINSSGTAASAYRHGTAMAGLIAAVANNHLGIVGIAPLARIEVFQACWQLRPDADEAACNTFTLAKALAGAIEARLPLVNLSIAGPSDPLLTELVREGLRRGVIFVGSMADAPGAFPTNIEGVIGVGSAEHLQTNATLAAPSTHVLTLRPQGQYDFVSGTSVAAAEMTGVIALLLGANGHLRSDRVVSLLKETATGRGDSAPGPAAVDAAAAVARVFAEQSGGRMAAATRSAR